VDLAGGNGPVEVPDPEDSSTMVESVITFSGQQSREPLVGDLVSSPEGVVFGGENARDSVAVGDMCRLGGNGTSENGGSDSGIGSAAEGIEAVFSAAGYGRPPLGCLTPLLESVGSGMEGREDAVLGMDIYRLERGGAREGAGSDPEDVSTREGMGAMLSGTGNTKPQVGYWTQSPEGVGSSMGEMEVRVLCRDIHHFEGNGVRENTGSEVEGTLIWTRGQTPLMVDRTPSLGNEKVYNSYAGDAIPLSDLHQLGKEVGSRVDNLKNGAHRGSTAEDCDTLVDSTDPEPLDLSRDQVNSKGEELKHEGVEWEAIVVTAKVDPERRKSTIKGENRMLIKVVDPEPLTGDREAWIYGRGEGCCGKRETVSVNGGFLRGKEIDKG